MSLIRRVPSHVHFPTRWARAAVCRCLAVFLAAAGIAGRPAVAQELPWTGFGPSSPGLQLPSWSVQKVFQDRQGFIWFALYSSGLARYDGQVLETYGFDDGLTDLTVREIAQDEEGYLWVGLETGPVVSEIPLPHYATTERVRFRSRVGGEDLVRDRIRRHWITPLPHGGVVLGTASDGAHRYRILDGDLLEHSRIVIPRPEDGGEPAPVSAVLAQRAGSVWIALDDGRLLHSPTVEEALVAVPRERAPSNQVTALAEGPTGTVWAGCTDGSVWRSISTTPPSFERITTSLDEFVTSIQELRDGSLWVGSIGDGLLWLPDPSRPADTVRLQRRQGLPNETVWDLEVDSEGNLWVAHNAGCSRLTADFEAFMRFTGFSHAGVPPTLPEPTVFTALAAEELPEVGVLWVGTGGGLVAIGDRGEVLANVGIEDGLQSDSIYALCADPPDRLWVGTLDGLALVSFGDRRAPPAGGTLQGRVSVGGQPATVRTYPISTVYNCALLRPPSLETGGDSWLAIAGIGGLDLWADGRWHHFGQEQGLPGAGVTAAVRASDDRLWIGSKDRGLLRSRRHLSDIVGDQTPQNGGPTPGSSAAPLFEPVWNRELGAPVDTVHSVIAHGERVWAGTGSGVVAIDVGTTAVALHLDGRSGLGGDMVMSVAWDPAANLVWVSQNQGLAALEPTTGRIVRRVSRADGLVDNEVWLGSSVSVSPDGTILMGTPRGLSLYRPSLDEIVPVPPRIALRAASFTQTLSGFNQLDLRFAALTFSNEESVRYRTRVLGLDDQWSPPTRIAELRLNNLTAFLVPRSYRVEVTASNGDGVSSEPVTIWTGSVRPAWWARWWAVSGYALVLGGLLLAAGSVRTRQLREHTRRLEGLVARRTSQIQAHVRAMETLDRIVETINREVKLERVMETLLHQGLLLLPEARRGAFLYRDPEHERFQIAAVSGWESDLAAGGTLSAEDAVERFTSGAIALEDGIHILHRVKDRSGTTILEHLRTSETILSIDLTVEDRVEGFLVFELDAGDQVVDDIDARPLQRYRQHAISALGKARVVRELEIKSREAAAANKAKSDFLATMSHELRTPLNSIIGFSEILLSRTDGSDARSDRFLRNILSSGRHLLSLINDILDLSKIEAGRMQLEAEPVNLAEIVEGVQRIMSGIAAKRGIEIVAVLPDALPELVLDGLKLKHVLHNLVSNAVKFSHDRGVVHLSVAAVPAADSPLARDSVRIDVADDGIGIAPDQQELIFEEFHQVDSGTARRFVGTGLGLALVRRYVRLHGGLVKVHSTLGEGSVFSVILPTDVRPHASSA